MKEEGTLAPRPAKEQTRRPPIAHLETLKNKDCCHNGAHHYHCDQSQAQTYSAGNTAASAAVNAASRILALWHGRRRHSVACLRIRSSQPRRLPTTDSSARRDDDAASANSSILQQHYSLSNLPLHKLIHSSLSAVADVDVRKDLAANIVLVGGCSVTPGLEQRLAMELQSLLPSAYKPKLVASKFAIERQCASWIGASVLSSLGSFQQLWLSRTEYDEYGAALALQRFP